MLCADWPGAWLATILESSHGEPPARALAGGPAAAAEPQVAPVRRRCPAPLGGGDGRAAPRAGGPRRL